MKKLLNLSLLLTLFAFCISFTGCEKEGTGDFALSIKAVGPDYVDVFVTAPEKMEMAYIVSDEAQLVTPAVLFNTGTVIEVSPGETVRIDENIVTKTHYNLYAVGKVNGAYTEKIALEFTTKDYNFSETITIVDTYYDGFKVHVTIPEEVKKRGNVLRYGYLSQAMYNKTRKLYGTIDVERLIENGNIYGRYIKNDSTLVYNAANCVEIDPTDGSELDLHDDIFPDEPGVFMVGEFRWASSKQEIEDEIKYSGWGPSYIIPLFDWNTLEWTGEFSKMTFRAKAPNELDADFDIEVYDVGQLDATIYFNPDEDVYQYMCMVLDDNTYAAMVDLCGGEENIQWFVASTLGYFEGATMFRGPIELSVVSEFMTEPLAKGTHYNILVNAWGDAKGTSQKFIRSEFTTKQATKPRPVVEVTAVQDGNPYLATFNIKAGKDKDGNVQPIVGAYFGANYARDFQLLFNQGATYETLLKGNYSFTPDELAMINTEEGYNYSVYTLDGETTRMAVYGCNEEYTFNEVDPSEEDVASGIARGWADYKAPYAEGPGEVSAYRSVLDKVEGVWTASATLQAKQKVGEDENGDPVYEKYNLEHKSRIDISASIPELPMPMPDSVYTLYAGKPTAEVDGMYEELQLLTEQFSEARLAPYSRILCTGFLDFDYHKTMGRNDLRLPYDLFVARDYVSVDVAQIIYDFGPKWFMEVQEDGSVIVPMDSYYLPPMHNWPGYPFYVGANSSTYAFYDANETYPGFPVEISEDGNKIVIKPMVIEGETYYMNALGLSNDAIMSNSVELVAPVISEITLTRGWTEPETKVIAKPEVMSVPLRNPDGSQTVAPVKYNIRSMTDFGQPVIYQKADDICVMTEEKLDRMMTREVEKLFNTSSTNE